MGIFDKFKNGLKKTRDFVKQSVQQISANMGFFDEDMLDELEMILIQSDAGISCSNYLIERIKQQIKATGDASNESVVKTLRAGMLDILGEKKNLSVQPDRLNIILLVGVNGTGKTTTSGKLAYRYMQAGHKVIFAAADTFRAAAIDQLRVWADRSSATLIAHAEGSDPAAVVYDGIQAAKARKADVLIIDTAGRLHNKKNLMEELNKIRRVISREAEQAAVESLLIIDATTGQNAVLQAKAFGEVADISAIAITKLDGNAKGGVALAVAEECKVPIVLAGLGEQIDDLQDFDPQVFVDSLVPENMLSNED